MPAPVLPPPPNVALGSSYQNVIDQAAAAWHVPSNILVGVWGMESSFSSSNIPTSSAGAEGPFQFLPSTASSYNYPLTGNPSPTQFAQQANAAAHYLSDLFHQHGNWDAAIRAYSGGGYGLAQVQSKSSSSPDALGNAPLLPSLPSVSIPNPLSAVGDAISGVWNSLVNDAKYAAVLVVALFVAGYLMVYGITGRGRVGR
jgi:hypothetical protein